MTQHPKIQWEFVPPEDIPPDPVMPEGGWLKPCSLDDHSWELHVEDGQASLMCRDPHPEDFGSKVDPAGPLPVCLHQYWVAEDMFGEGIPVKVRHIDDSVPSSPAGPAEYGFYLEIEADG